VSGLSDHTLGITAAIASVALGASIIEKHVTLSRSDGGPDSKFSLEPKELKEMVSSIREAEKAIGKPFYRVSKSEEENDKFKRSLFSVKDIKKGHKFTKDNIRSIRPGYGLAPKYYNDIIGKSSSADIKKHTPLNWKLISK
ncbi:N-acetylneuraminate synthase family protein, partial [Patescibacteria group bacterium]|nr:N-acetylneuraminate synthase family protein [Patescibacteria group bacterium]